MESEKISDIKKMQAAFEIEMTQMYGPLMTGRELVKALGYPTGAAFRQSVNRKTVPIKVFEIENRRGKFALTKDVANFLINQRYGKEKGEDM